MYLIVYIVYTIIDYLYNYNLFKFNVSVFLISWKFVYYFIIIIYVII